MSEEVSNVIKVFEKFLDDSLIEKMRFSKKGKVKKLQTIDDILELPIYSYKFLSESEAKILEEVLDIFDIGEAAKLNKDDPFGILTSLDSTEDPIKASELREQLKQQIEVLQSKFPNLLKNLKKAITISSLIVNIKKDSVELEKKEQKVVVVGLDNAGKTAILTKFGGGLGIGDLANLKPTKGVDRQTIGGSPSSSTSNLDLIVWDLGGQLDYRKKYLAHPEQYFLQMDLLIYVLDIQDYERYEESLRYFKEILDIIITLEENPYVLIFLHKYDPDIADDPQIELRVEMLKDVLKETFRRTEYEFDYEIYLTSVFSLISTEPKFSKYLKEIMKTNTSLTDPTIRKVEGLGDILSETMNAVIRLSESISIQLNDIELRLRAIESGAVQVSGVGAVPGLKTPDQVEPAEEHARSRVLDELKDLFARKKKFT